MIVSKRFLNLPNLLILIKQGSLSPPVNLAFANFYELHIVVATKLNLLFLLSGPEGLSSLI